MWENIKILLTCTWPKSQLVQQGAAQTEAFHHGIDAPHLGAAQPPQSISQYETVVS